MAAKAAAVKAAAAAKAAKASAREAAKEAAAEAREAADAAKYLPGPFVGGLLDRLLRRGEQPDAAERQPLPQLNIVE